MQKYWEQLRFLSLDLAFLRWWHNLVSPLEKAALARRAKLQAELGASDTQMSLLLGEPIETLNVDNDIPESIRQYFQVQEETEQQYITMAEHALRQDIPQDDKDEILDFLSKRRENALALNVAPDGWVS